MRISGYTDFNLKSVFLKDPKGKCRDIADLSSIKAKIVAVNANAVKLLFDDIEMIATSNIPLENLLGQQVDFNVLKDGKNIVLQPKIQGNALEVELNIKIFNLLTDLKLQNTKENRDIVKEMIKQNIPVNNENFKELRDNINAVNLLKDMPKNEIDSLKDGIKNISDKELKDILKSIYITNKGSNVDLILKDIDSLELENKDFAFLFKNKYKLNVENLKMLNQFLKDENISNVIGKLEMLINTNNDTENIMNKVNTEDNIKEFNLNLNKGDVVTKLKNDTYNDLKGEKDNIHGFNDKNDVQEIQSNNKKITNFIKNIVQNLDENPEVNLDKFKENFKNLVNEITQDVSTKNESIKEIANKLEFLNKLSNDNLYFQIPFEYKQYKSMAEVLVKKNKCKDLKNEDNLSVFISLNTNNFNKIDTLLNYNKKNNNLNLVFNAVDEKILMLFKNNELKLKNAIKNVGIENICINYKIKEENKSILENIAYIQNEFSNFSVWV